MFLLEHSTMPMRAVHRTLRCPLGAGVSESDRCSPKLTLPSVGHILSIIKGPGQMLSTFSGLAIIQNTQDCQMVYISVEDPSRPRYLKQEQSAIGTSCWRLRFAF